ncbi:MAG: hypothetical protein QOK05_744 [Chloroflexota bacterium]|jgi:nitrite reductase/ring-hydroxylating ferredoxin subunit/uncharacterized membrane protein|nr:hypothetical protein [Chloroflexota bacterium]
MTQGRVGRTLTDVVSGLEQSALLDDFSNTVTAVVHGLTESDTIKNALSGAWLGHALHPLLTDLPIGFWMSAVTLDIVGGKAAEGGADLLLGLGNLSALGTAATGLADWSDSNDGAEKRVGVVHGVANVAGLALMAGSWLARRSGARGTGKALGMMGIGVAGASAYLGGHLLMARGLGVTHAGYGVDEEVGEWTDVAAAADLVEGKPMKVSAKNVEVMLLKQDGEVRALANLCGHAGGPLHKGDVGEGDITCPWHGSRFQLVDGCVLRGPASMPQPAFVARVRGDRVEVRAA